MWFGTAGTGAVETLAFAPDSRTLYTGAHGQLVAWDTSSRERTVLVKATDPDTSFWFNLSPCGRFILVRNADQIIVRDAGTGNVVSRDRFTADLRPDRAMSPCGRYYTAYSTNVRTVRRWDWAARCELESLVMKLPPVTGLGEWFALHTSGRAAFGNTFKPELGLYDPSTGAEFWRVRVPNEQSYWRVLFDRSGERVLLVGHDADNAALRTSDGALLWSGKPGGRRRSATQFAFHPSRPLFGFVSALGTNSRSCDQSAWFGDLNTGERVLVPDPGFKRANCVAFSPDGLTCAIGSSANKFCVFDLDV